MILHHSIASLQCSSSWWCDLFIIYACKHVKTLYQIMMQNKILHHIVIVPGFF